MTSSNELIKQYYKRAWSALKNGQPELAKEILYEQMPVELYDLSLDILYNYNIKFSDEELRQLILNVDRTLNSDPDEDMRALFINDINTIF